MQKIDGYVIIDTNKERQKRVTTRVDDSIKDNDGEQRKTDDEEGERRENVLMKM